uniref:Uncharacterized protein n=1 Tax=Photinus pyralis TaxID=7054 RepID=A0A1Y1LG41_PHOPY
MMCRLHFELWKERDMLGINLRQWPQRKASLLNMPRQRRVFLVGWVEITRQIKSLQVRCGLDDRDLDGLDICRLDQGQYGSWRVGHNVAPGVHGINIVRYGALHTVNIMNNMQDTIMTGHQ